MSASVTTLTYGLLFQGTIRTTVKKKPPVLSELECAQNKCWSYILESCPSFRRLA